MSRTVGISLSLDSLIAVISYSVRFNARKMILYVSTLLHLSSLEMFKPFWAIWVVEDIRRVTQVMQLRRISYFPRLSNRVPILNLKGPPFDEVKKMMNFEIFSN